MERYSEYKDSGVKWLGQIPSHWEMLPGLAVFEENKEKNSELSENTVLSLSYGNIVVKKDINEGLVPAEYNTYQIVHPGYIIIRCTDLQNDKVSLRTGLVKNDGIITSAYLGLIVSKDYNSSYIHYFLHSWDITKEIYRHGSGLRQSLSWLDLRRLQILLPSREEQDKIVSYLISATSKIDEAIAQQQKMIDLLNERKQIIINNAVSKGLDPNVKMKPSGIDWIGDIPDHWDIVKLKRLARGFSNGTSLSQLSSGETQYPVTRIETISTGEINYEKVGYVNYDSSLSRYRMQTNDILISNINSFERVGNSAIYNGDGILYHGMNLLKITPLNEVNPFFLVLFLKSQLFIHQMKLACKPAINQVSVPSTSIKNMLVVLPSINDQKKIIDYCNYKITEIIDAISSREKIIALLQERKQIIINDVVTGKVKVV